MEETTKALNDLIKSGKVRCLGASSMRAWQFTRMNAIAEKNGWTQFVAMQDCYNLLYREEEREMIEYLQHQGVAEVLYSQLENGRLARVVGTSTTRAEADVGKPWVRKLTDVDNEIIRRVHAIVEKKIVPMVQVSPI
jgi:aryl-alcohol dehydrogenase-like predicted oxidoreductase